MERSLLVRCLCAGFFGFALGLLVLNSRGSSAVQDSTIAMSAIPRLAQQHAKMMAPNKALASLPGGAWKELALAAIEANSGCHAVGDIKPTPRFTAAMANLRNEDIDLVMSKVASQSKLTVRAAKRQPVATKKVASAGSSWLEQDDRVGAFPPFGYWDPLGLATTASAGTIAYFREAELKHGRVCMLASLGFLVGENFHPLFGGNIDVPSLYAVTKTELSLFWPAVLAAAGGIELATGFDRAEDTDDAGFSPSLKAGVEPGDIGFDPLGLKAKYSDSEYIKVQNQELAHGRWAMIATLGMIMQELIVPDQKLR